MKPELPQVKLELNIPQLLFSMSRKKETYLEIGRGGGKSTIIADRLKNMVYAMPRAKIGIVGETYQQLLTRTLPGTIEGLQMLGFKRNQHFFAGTRPPRSWRWPEAYQPPLHYENYISFYNGFGAQLISLDNPNSGRGINLDGGIGDEAAVLNTEKLANNFLTANRGNIHRFSHTWLHHSLLFASSTPVTAAGRWFRNMEQLAKLKENEKQIFYLRASSLYNAHNLGAEFFKTNKRLLTDLQYDAEILCILPGKVTNGFYPLFDEKVHTYTSSNDLYLFSLNHDYEKLKKETCERDADLKKNEPIDIALDYGAKINTLVCGQEYLLNQYNVLNALHVKSPNTVQDLAEKFCKYYSSHICKEVNYYYDHTAEYRTASSATTFADEVTKVLENNGWQVNRIYVGQAAGHNAKFNFFNVVYGEKDYSLPRIRYNKDNCKNLITSIQQAGAIDGSKGVQKDKRPERNVKAIDEETTHYSDAKDTLLYFKFKDRIIGTGWLM